MIRYIDSFIMLQHTSITSLETAAADVFHGGCLQENTLTARQPEASAMHLTCDDVEAVNLNLTSIDHEMVFLENKLTPGRTEASAMYCRRRGRSQVPGRTAGGSYK